VVSASGTIYVATNAGVLHALNPTTGADLWTFDGGGPYTGETDLSTSPLVLPQGSILWPGPAGTLYELSSVGHVLWSHRFDGMVLSPARAGTRVFVGLMSGTVWELNVGGSVPVLGWSTSVGHTSFGSPVVSPDGDVVVTADKSVVALAGATGAVRWRHTASASIEVSPSVAAGGEIYVTANDGSVYGLRRDGSLAWRRHIGQESYSSSSVSSNGLLYFGDNGGALNIVRAASGDVVRTDRGTKGIWAAQAIDHRGDVYFGTQGGEIYGYDAAGHRLFHLRATGPFDSYPALSADGSLLIGDEAGTLYSIG
jgi:outer membrane protein assembly factor BamB